MNVVGTGDIPGYYEDSCQVTEMDNVRKLIENGVLFKHAHATPLCAPSRYAFLSGNYQIRGVGAKNKKKTGVIWGLGDDKSQFKPGQKSIANAFADAGYNTAMVGKWHVGGKILVSLGLSSICRTLLGAAGGSFSWCLTDS